MAKMSPWLQTDSKVEAVRRNSEEVGVFCTMTAIVRVRAALTGSVTITT